MPKGYYDVFSTFQFQKVGRSAVRRECPPAGAPALRGLAPDEGRVDALDRGAEARLARPDTGGREAVEPEQVAPATGDVVARDRLDPLDELVQREQVGVG